jgi:hypothetical protein
MLQWVAATEDKVPRPLVDQMQDMTEKRRTALGPQRDTLTAPNHCAQAKGTPVIAAASTSWHVGKAS